MKVAKALLGILAVIVLGLVVPGAAAGLAGAMLHLSSSTIGHGPPLRFLYLQHGLQLNWSICCCTRGSV